MASPLANPAFRTLFAAQICSLVAIGLLTVALSLAAFSLGGEAGAGRILSLLLAVKMVAYVFIAPLAEAVLAGRPRRRVMIGLDIARIALLLPMAFATELWQLAVLAFAFFAASSGFTPLFQSVIPDILPDKVAYGKALAWSRIAYTLEAVLSPVLAALLLRVLAAEHLFIGAAAAFVGSVGALLLTQFPAQQAGSKRRSFLSRAAMGLRIYRETPRLRGLFLSNFALSLAMAWVLVNSVVFASVQFGAPERSFPILMMAYGLGAAIGAVVVPRLLRSRSERTLMVAGTLSHAVLGLFILFPLGTIGFHILWAGFGLSASLVLTPGGLVIARSAQAEDRAAVFAAQFSLSHGGWLVAYLAAGWLAPWLGLAPSLVILSAGCAAVGLLALRVWPADDPIEREHSHPELSERHPHLTETPSQGRMHKHSHAYFIDDLHPNWSGSRPA